MANWFLPNQPLKQHKERALNTDRARPRNQQVPPGPGLRQLLGEALRPGPGPTY